MAHPPPSEVDSDSPLRTVSELAVRVRGLVRPELRRPGEIHDLRVALRRLRVGLSVLRASSSTLRGIDRPRRLDAALRRLLHRLGPLRDWDVLGHKLATASASMCGTEAKTLRKPLARRRKRRLRKVQHELDAHRSRRVRKQLLKLRRHLDASLAAASPTRSRRAFRALAGATLGPRLENIQRHVATLDPADEDALHRLRVQLKKLRYAAELFAPLFPTARTATFLRQVESVQAVLGQAHDAAIEPMLLAQLPRASRQLAQRRLRGRTEQLHISSELDVQACLQTMSALQAFWLVTPRPARGN